MNIIGVCFWVTTKCNLRCNICYADLNTVKNNNLTGYYKIIDKLKEFKIKKITFTGGDPMFLKEIEAITIYAHELGFKVAVTTNANTLNGSILNRLQNSIDELSIPMDGFHKATSDIHRTEKHDHSNVMNIISKSRDYSILIDVSTVITRVNKNEVLKILDYLISNKIYKWKVFQYSNLDNPDYNTVDFSLSNDEFSRIKIRINNYIKNNNCIIQVDYRDNSNDSINSYINLLPNGNVILGSGDTYLDSGNLLDFTNYDNFISVLLKHNFSFSNHEKRHYRDTSK